MNVKLRMSQSSETSKCNVESRILVATLVLQNLLLNVKVMVENGHVDGKLAIEKQSHIKSYCTVC